MQVSFCEYVTEHVDDMYVINTLFLYQLASDSKDYGAHMLREKTSNISLYIALKKCVSAGDHQGEPLCPILGLRSSEPFPDKIYLYNASILFIYLFIYFNFKKLQNIKFFKKSFKFFKKVKKLK